MTTTTPGAADVELAIGGMTCASCAARIEKKLNRMDGVEATVNYATEKAKVTFREDVSVADLIATVEATGYTATPARARTRTDVPGPRPDGTRAAGSRTPAGELRTLRQRLTHGRRPRRPGDRDVDGPGPPVRSTGSGSRSP